MNCNEFEKNIPLFLKGMLDDNKLSEFATHADSCVSCDEKFNEEYGLGMTLGIALNDFPNKYPSFTNRLAEISELFSKDLQIDKTKKELKKIFDEFHNLSFSEYTKNDLDIYVRSLQLEAKIYLKEEKPAEALKCLKDAVKLRPDKEEVKKDINKLEKKYPLAFIIIEKLKSLKSAITESLSFQVICYDTYFAQVKATEDQKNTHMVEDEIKFSLDIPKSGALCVFHYDENYNIKLIFPSDKKDDVNVKAGEKKQFNINISQPGGKHCIQAILALEELKLPAKEYSDFSNFANEFVDLISEIGSDACMEAIYEFEVIDI